MSSVSAFQNALRNRPEVQDLTVGDGMSMGGGVMGSTTLRKQQGRKRELMCIYYSIDPHFLSVFQIPLLKGRNLSDSFGTDKKEAFLVNEAFVKTMGWKTAIGQAMEGMEHKGQGSRRCKKFLFQIPAQSDRTTHNGLQFYPANTTTIKIKPRDLPMVKTLFKTVFARRSIRLFIFR